jgi:hypothetical protein
VGGDENPRAPRRGRARHRAGRPVVDGRLAGPAAGRGRGGRRGVGGGLLAPMGCCRRPRRGEGRTARASCTCPGGATNARLRRHREAGVGGRGGDAAVPGIEREGVVPYRVLGQAPGSRSGTRPDGPGCVVLVDIATENRDRTTGWVTSMLELPPGDTEQTGLTAATSHVSLDGTRVLKLAGWSTSRATSSPRRGGRSPDVERLVMAAPGVRVLGHRRFTWWETAACGRWRRRSCRRTRAGARSRCPPTRGSRGPACDRRRRWKWPPRTRGDRRRSPVIDVPLWCPTRATNRRTCPRSSGRSRSGASPTSCATTTPSPGLRHRRADLHADPEAVHDPQPRARRRRPHRPMRRAPGNHPGGPSTW